MSLSKREVISATKLKFLRQKTFVLSVLLLSNRIGAKNGPSNSKLPPSAATSSPRTDTSKQIHLVGWRKNGALSQACASWRSMHCLARNGHCCTGSKFTREKPTYRGRARMNSYTEIYVLHAPQLDECKARFRRLKLFITGSGLVEVYSRPKFYRWMPNDVKDHVSFWSDGLKLFVPCGASQ